VFTGVFSFSASHEMNIPNWLEAVRIAREAEEENERHEDTKHEIEGDGV
jgi:hypothetical protein